MSDQAVSLEASDVLGLGGSFIPQSSTTTTNQEWARMTAADGKWLKWSNEFNDMTEVSVTYKFNAIIGLPAALPNLGAVSNGYLITEIGIESTYNDWPTITFTAHNHGTNAHIDDRNKWDLSTELATATGAFGSYDWAGKAAGAVCATRSTITASLNHVDAECSGGDHWTGQSIQAQLSATVEYVGAPLASTTVTGWNTASFAYDDSNENFDTSTITIEKPLDGTISTDPA
jgi:hypothetical protein